MVKIKEKKTISSRSRSNKLPPVTVVVTVLNEEDSILLLLDALRNQDYSANEVIITDGGSSDQTLKIIRQYARQYSTFPLKFSSVPGNRSQGRNKAITLSKNELIAITDAGCFPHIDWLKNLLIEGQQLMQKTHSKEILVAGYYDARPKNAFEEAVVPYVLVMPDKVNEHHFLPATRSVLFTKSTWKKVGKFDETLADNEDYPFARKAEKLGIPLGFTSKAKVTWLPRENIGAFSNMIFRYARGDAYAQAWRPKVALLFIRYIVLITILLIMIFPLDLHCRIIMFVVFLLLIYSIWAIKKNKKYTAHGWYWLPLLQIVADWSIMAGTLAGIFARVFKVSIIAPHLKKN